MTGRASSAPGGGGTPPAWRPWTLEGLTAAWSLNASGARLSAIASALDRTPGEIDRACWTLLGRTPAQALALLNSRAPAPTSARSPRTLRRFLAGLFE